MKKEIKVFAPATVANVVCAYDILGFALNSPGDEVVIREGSKKGIHITKITGDNGVIPKDTTKNTASVGIIHLLDKLSIKANLEIEIHKKMPLNSGLGSSAASGAAAIFAVNELLNLGLTKHELLESALISEKVACGVAHADNIAPSLLGGFVLIRSYEPLDVIKLPVKTNLFAIVVHPDIEVRTEDSRNVLKKDIKLKDAVEQWGNISGLVAGLLMDDLDLVGRSLIDNIIEPERSMLIPGFEYVKGKAISNGALGCGISGSGPSMFALAKSESKAKSIGKAMQEGFSDKNIESQAYVSSVNTEGAVIL
ncbi:UNVERIFIED_CONTAM: hypothetical protein GTU68_046331 [Idotea baltica]|nr:hypothetical protein [Idotea baltica]